MNQYLSAAALGLAVTACMSNCRADAIIDWDTKATAVASPAALGEREVAIVDLAMFDAVNAIAPRYQSYLQEAPSSSGPASSDAAAASAAATALSLLHPQSANDFKTALAEYLSHVPASAAEIDAGVRLGATIGKNIYDSRATDGATAADTYRPKTTPGQYIPTATMVGSAWPMMRPFVLTSPSQFRPGPPAALQSREWATDYNEIRELGGKISTKRTPAQTETAQFWLMVGPQAYHPLARQMIVARHLDLVDSARFMALYAVALTDAYIAVYDAKYHYEFWRPVTAIRNGDLDGNPETPTDATWQPLDATPMHPEYPCAHCTISGAARAVLESAGQGQPMPVFVLTSPTAPGVTHHWSNLEDFTAEVANARVWSGFHYRFSTRVGTALGGQVGHYVVANTMKPIAAQP
jgi:hypothetical protein